MTCRYEIWHNQPGTKYCSACSWIRDSAVECPNPELNFKNIGENIGALVAEKQKAYGDSFGRAGNVLRELFPNGIKPEQYDEVLTIARVLDKLFRIATQKEAFGENPWRDVAGYAILSVARDQKK